MARTNAGQANGRFEDTRDYVQSLARGLAVLRAFDSEHASMNLSEIAARADLSRAVARRLLLTLTHLGYVRASGREFSLSARVLELGFGYLGSLNLTDLAQPLVEDLARSINENCSMAVLAGASIVYVVRVPVRRVMTATLGVGARLPAISASMGRVLLAGLPEGELKTWLGQYPPAQYTPHTITEPRKLRRVIDQVRTQGYAYVEQELELGLCSIAVPIRNTDGQVAAALNASMSYRPDTARRAVEEILPRLRETATAIERGTSAIWLPPVSL